MNSRERILGRLRRSLNEQPVTAPAPLSVATHWQDPAPAEWLALFKQNLTDNHAEVIECRQQDWIAVLAERLAEKNIRVLRSGRTDAGEALVAALGTQLDCACVTDALSKNELFTQIDAGFSVALAGLAETGTLVVKTGPQEPRTLSLVPPLNIVLLPVSAMQAGFSAWVAQGGLPQPLPTNLLLISGPSKTADIQQTLAYGAHGPKELIVLLMTDA